MKRLHGILVGVAFVLAIGSTLHAQTYFLQSYGNIPAPFPFDPYYGMEPMVQLANGTWLIEDTPEDFQEMQSFNNMSRSSAMSMDGPVPPGGGGASGGDFYSDSFNYHVPTNGLWLEMTNISSGMAFLNLHNASNFVYEIFSKTNLLEPDWDIISEVFPSDTNSMPFSLPMDNQPSSLFIWSRDWTGITSHGNSTPEWWLWKYFGTVAISDTNVEDQGNTLLYDYTNGFDPNIINFTLSYTNQYVKAANVSVQATVTTGVPVYYAVVVDSTNFSAANWNTYTSSNIVINLGAAQGWHDVWVGLCGLPKDAQQAWQWKHLYLAAPPVLVITNPVANAVSQPVIQIYGYCPESLASISYDVSNALGFVANQPSEVTDQYFDQNLGEFTTNYFECLDVPLTNGMNTITLHVMDLAGNTTTTNFNFTLDYSSKTNPPVVQITWPQNGTQISGSNFTCRGWVDDPTATVSVQLAFNDGNTNDFVNGNYTNTFIAGVDRTGNFWLENLPLQSGTNNFTVKVQDAAGNVSTTNLTVIQSSLVLTINPASDSLWQSMVSLTGTISATDYAVWVNGVKGHNNGDGTWSASDVPVNDGGTANFTATAYAPDEQQPDGSYGN